MKLFSKSEMQALESAAEAAGVSLFQMMESAGSALADLAQEVFPLLPQPVVLLCGKGNNGGDGFVCARRLCQDGIACMVVLVQGPPATDLARAAFSALPNKIPVLTQPNQAEAALSTAGLVIDCVYGFGFRGELDPAAARLLSYANGVPCPRLSADLPSGVECDTGRASPHSFRADITLAFTAQKIAHQSYPAKEFCGQVKVCQVGVPGALLCSAKTRACLTNALLAKNTLKPPGIQANKGSQGRLLLVAGSYGMAGACMMAARAALRCGVGLLDIAVEQSLYPVLAAAIPEAVFTVYTRENAREQLIAALGRCTACVVGCGLGELAALVCPIIFGACTKPLLIDADGLNYCAQAGLPRLSSPIVLTPHPGEMARLCKSTVPEVQAQRIPIAQSLSKESGAVVLLKGAATVIAGPDSQLALNSTGNPGMAKGGSGDVLSGIIGSLLAQGVHSFQAAAVGAWLHGKAGDLCQKSLSPRAMLPTDLIEMLPEIFKKTERL